MVPFFKRPKCITVFRKVAWSRFRIHKADWWPATWAPPASLGHWKNEWVGVHRMHWARWDAEEANIIAEAPLMQPASVELRHTFDLSSSLPPLPLQVGMTDSSHVSESSQNGKDKAPCKSFCVSAREVLQSETYGLLPVLPAIRGPPMVMALCLILAHMKIMYVPLWVRTLLSPNALIKKKKKKCIHSNRFTFGMFFPWAHI